MNREKMSGSFYFRRINEQLKKNESIKTIMADLFFLLIYLIGMIGWTVSAFQISVNWPILLIGFGVVSSVITGLFFLFQNGKKAAIWIGAIIWCILSAVFVGQLIQGWNLVLNQIVDTLGKQYPYMWPFYETVVSGDAAPLAASLVSVWTSVILGTVGLYILKSGNRLLLGVHFVCFVLIQMLGKLSPALFWNGAAVFSFFALWIGSHGTKLPMGRQRLSALASVVLLFGMSLLITGGISLFLPKDSYIKNEEVEKWKTEVRKEIEDKRYQGSSQVLPEGDFTGLSSFQTSEMPVLEITMTQPEAYYLRGFIGSVYTGDGWKESESKERWEYRALFYWLHEEGYYGQEILSQAASVLGEQMEQNRITIKNINGSSKYCYVPYELITSEDTEGLPFESQKIGDEGLLFFTTPSREYSYTALMDQVTSYAVFAAKLLDSDNLDQEEKDYQKKESYYNEFVYKTYLDVPENLRFQLKNLVGDTQVKDGQKHVDYAEAKQNILYILNSECTYEENLKEKWDGSDLVVDFLTGTKEGYSVHFASAAAMLFRYYGIPARYVEGYLVTPSDVEHMTNEEPYILDETHAHAWVEYYQDGVGWLPFETTPSYLNVMPKTEAYQNIVGSTSENGTKQEEKSQDLDEEEPQEEPFDWFLIVEILLVTGIAILCLFLLVIVVHVVMLRQKSKKEKRTFMDQDRREAVRSIFSYTMNILAVAGLQIQNTSLYRYRVPIEKMFDEETGKCYEEVVTIRQEAIYSDHEITEEQRKKMLEFKDKIWKRVYDGAGWIQRFQLKYIYFL